MFRFFKKKPPAPPAITPAASPPEADTSAPQIAAVPPPAVAPTAAPIVAPVAAPAPAPTAAPIAAPVPAPVAAPVPPPVQPAPAPAFEAAPAAAPVQAPAPAPAFKAAPVAVPAAPVVSVSTPVTDTAAPYSPAITAAPGSFAAPKAIDAPTPVSAPENTVPVTQNDLAAAVTEAPTVVPAVSTPSLSAQPPVQVVPPVQPTPPVQATPFTKPSAPAVTPPAPPEPAKKASWLSRLKQGLSRTGQTIGNLFIDVPVDENLFEELESALIMADAGVEATAKLLTALRARVKKDRLDDATKVKRALREILADHLRPLEKTFDTNRAQPLVVMIAGVNGAGKTTSIGKLAHTFQQQGASVLLAAGDTFRAAAREQLVEWGRRNNVTVISQDGGDPAAVAFDAVNAGRARKTGVVMIDTAGRLPTQLNLMEELKKIRRVIGKADPQAPHEVLLVIDGNTGQNAIAQIRAFDAAITLTGLVVTKLDGTAKGGTLAAVAAGSQGVRPVPVYWIGVGEGMQDLQPFVADEFAQALLGD